MGGLSTQLDGRLMLPPNGTNDQCEPKVISAAVVCSSQVVEKGNIVGVEPVLALRDGVDAYTRHVSTNKAERDQK